MYTKNYLYLYLLLMKTHKMDIFLCKVHEGDLKHLGQNICMCFIYIYISALMVVHFI